MRRKSEQCPLGSGKFCGGIGRSCVLTYDNNYHIIKQKEDVIVRPKHPNKDIEQAIRYAESKHWRYQPTGNSAHAWGRMLCPLATRDGHAMSIWSTPKSAENHARQIIRNVDACEHTGG